MTSLPGAGGGHTADVAEITEWLYDEFWPLVPGTPHPALPALARLEAAANRTASLEDALEWKNVEQMRQLAAAEAERDAALAALRALVAAVDPLMDSKPVEVMPDGLLRYDWTPALYAIQKAIGPARAVLGGPEAAA